jgi:hypothetical protein
MYLYSIIVSFGKTKSMVQIGNVVGEVSKNWARFKSHYPNASMFPTIATLSPTLVI